jgi:hypothetical protein
MIFSLLEDCLEWTFLECCSLDLRHVCSIVSYFPHHWNISILQCFLEKHLCTKLRLVERCNTWKIQGEIRCFERPSLMAFCTNFLTKGLRFQRRTSPCIFQIVSTLATEEVEAQTIQNSCTPYNGISVWNVSHAWDVNVTMVSVCVFYHSNWGSIPAICCCLIITSPQSHVELKRGKHWRSSRSLVDREKWYKN